MAATIRTPRLELTPLTAADAAELHALWTDAAVRRHLWDGVAIPPEQTAAAVAESERLFADSGYGLWGAREPGGGALARTRAGSSRKKSVSSLSTVARRSRAKPSFSSTRTDAALGASVLARTSARPSRSTP